MGYSRKTLVSTLATDTASPASAPRRRLRFESLETRRLLAQATLVEQSFRADDFSISTNFTYEFRKPEIYDYIDKIPNGTFTSDAGRVTWTSPQDGSGFFAGAATGDGRSTVYASGARRECAKYGFEDRGRLDFSLDASQSQFHRRSFRAHLNSVHLVSRFAQRPVQRAESTSLAVLRRFQRLVRGHLRHVEPHGHHPLRTEHSRRYQGHRQAGHRSMGRSKPQRTSNSRCFPTGRNGLCPRGG